MGQAATQVTAHFGLPKIDGKPIDGDVFYESLCGGFRQKMRF